MYVDVVMKTRNILLSQPWMYLCRCGYEDKEYPVFSTLAPGAIDIGVVYIIEALFFKIELRMKDIFLYLNNFSPVNLKGGVL